MPYIHSITLSPSSLHLQGGPHSQPFGTLTASALDANNRPVTGGALSWISSNPSFIVQPDSGNPSKASVGSYQPGTTTITVREASSGKSAQASVTVSIMDRGDPGAQAASRLQTLITGIVVNDQAAGRLVSGSLPVGSGEAPCLKSYSLNATPGEILSLELIVPGSTKLDPVTHILTAVFGVPDHYEIDVTPLSAGESHPGGSPSPIQPFTLAIHVALSPPVRSFNLDFVTRSRAGLSERSTQVFVNLLQESPLL